MQSSGMVQTKDLSVGKKAEMGALCLLILLILAGRASAQGADPLIGIWVRDEGFQVDELVLRSDGRYELDTRSTDSSFDFSSSTPGRYRVEGQSLILTPYEFLGSPQDTVYELQLAGETLSLTRTDLGFTEVYQFKPGSRVDVLARQNVERSIIGTWGRAIPFAGKEEYTFRPGGYYFLKSTPQDSQFPPQYIRGRYEQDNSHVTLKPYSEIDFFGNTLTLIRNEETIGDATAYELLPGSRDDVHAKAVAADAFLAGDNWQVGVWEIRDDVHTVDLTLRPDGHYSSTNAVELLRGLVRGRYALEPRRLQLSPFVGQGLYSRDNGPFGQVERAFELDYYDGELQLIDLDAISQSVSLAHKRPGSEAEVSEKTLQAQTMRAEAGWQIGIWEVHDPTGWMEITFRPDNRYLAQAGANGTASEVERGRYRLAGDKITLEPYSGLGPSRGFELDLYDGDLFLIGDLHRMVVARKATGSESVVTEKTRNPDALKGERGSILGLWTATLPGQTDELVFRPDGQFRLSRCANSAVSKDYGLYAVDMASRSLVYDSRITPVQTLGMDFYGNTLTLFGGLERPRTYTVNLGSVDAAVVASLAADAAEAQVDGQWLARVPIGPRDPSAVQVPTADIPADPNPGRIFATPTVFTGYHLYRRLIASWVYFNENGTIKSVPVVNTREFHFFPTGRVLVRFKNYRAGWSYPQTITDISDSWGAYGIGPKPAETDILHLFADNTLSLETDGGDRAEMTLENGRRNLFWEKDYQILSEWAAEQKPSACEPSPNADASLMNTGLALSTQITPDNTQDGAAIVLRLSGPVSNRFTLSGASDVARTLVLERVMNPAGPMVWAPFQTNAVPAGTFSIDLPEHTSAATLFRAREK